LRIGAPGGAHEQEADLPRVQRHPKPLDPAAMGSAAAPAVVHAALNAPGQPLDPAARARMERHFGHDFGRVRVHADGDAAQSADAVNALAYTAGDHVVFGAGQYAPASPRGDRLLAHELTHTLQQRSARAGIIQRALKFEFQTRNFVWAVKNTGAPDPKLLPRKYAPTSAGYEDWAGEESGDKPAYLALGHRGGPARPKGDVAFVEVEGPPVMKPAKGGIDPKKPAQFVMTYQFTAQVKVNDIIGKPVKAGQLRLTHETDHSRIANAKYNPDTFELQYFNADATRMDVHLNEKHLFEKGRVDHMKVGRKSRPDIDKKLPAQFIEAWTVEIDPKGDVDYFGKRAKVRPVTSVNNALLPGMKGKFNHKTWEKTYYIASDFTGTQLKKGAKRLDVHRDEDGSFAKGHVELMEKAKPLAAPKEQTAIELQSEHLGVLEFETPKWFRDWSELKDRVQDAVDMTKKMNATPSVKDKALVKAIDGKRTSATLGRIIEWPEADYSTKHLKNLRADKRRLVVQIIDDKWHADIQSSESIPLSQYASLMKQHEGPALAASVVATAGKIFSPAFKAAKLKKPGLDESRFAELKGFLQLIVTYIYRAQVVNLTGHVAKAAFALMARTSFASMYKNLLSEEEKDLFRSIVRDPKNPILAEVQALLGPKSKIKLTRTTKFFHTLAGTTKEKETHGPPIYDWLDGMIGGKDLLTGGKLSGALGAQKVSTKPGSKDFKHAKFEVRGTFPAADRTQPAANWVSYAKKIFDAARERVADTPDDPTTPGVDEASKTGLKD